MKIAQIAPLYESCPPRLYGGTERVVAYLTDELVRAGHDVTLFASGDSKTLAALDAPCERSLRLSPVSSDPLAANALLLGRAAHRAREFDVLHFHLDYSHFSSMTEFAGRTLTTQHGRLDLPYLVPVFREFAELPQVSISSAQRKPMPWANWIGTVHHGIPRDALTPGSGAGDYLAFLGRISPEKGIERAIEIAERSGVRLRVAAKIDRADRAYYESTVRTLMESPVVEFIGEIGETEKAEFLGNARALIFPIDWPEPFGLVMIESFACGTPVVAWNNGSIPEIVESGVNGYVVDSIGAAVDAVARVRALDRSAIRRTFEQRFCAERMAADYVRLYERLMHARDPAGQATRVA